MSATPTPEALALLESLGLTSADVERAQARKVREEKSDAVSGIFGKHATALRKFVKDGLEVSPIKGSSKEGSTWVGAVLTGTLDGYGVKVTITDNAAVEVAKAAAKSAKTA